MTYKQFAANLSGLMADGNDYPKDLLVSLYTSVKKHPLPWGGKEQRAVARSTSMKHVHGQELTTPKSVSRSMSSRSPFKPGKTTVDPSRAGLGRSAKHKPLAENHGSLWRKTLLEPDGKKVPLGKRSWRMYSVTLQNLDLHITKKGSSEMKITSIHHSLAEETDTDSKRSHVFKLTHADGSVILYQASSEKEARKWVRNINKSAALLSAAPLCSPIGSQLVYRRPLLPSAPSTLPPMNQLNKLQQLLKEQERDLAETEENVKVDEPTSEQAVQYFSDKIGHLKVEIKKYKSYIKTLQLHLRASGSSSEELKSSLDKSENGSLVSVTPSEPPLASPSAFDMSDNFAFTNTPEHKPVLSPPTHFITPQHRQSTLSPTSSLPNLSPILESPMKGFHGRSGGSSKRPPVKELYESSLNDANFSSIDNSNNSNVVNKFGSSTLSSHDQLPTMNGNPGLNEPSDSMKSQSKAGIQTTIIGVQTLPGDQEPFPVKRYEMRIAAMDSENCSQQSVFSKPRSRFPADASVSEDTDFVAQLNQSRNLALSRVRGRKEKKGIERYSYMQAVSPIENIN